jgi:hypothetical protein
MDNMWRDHPDYEHEADVLAPEVLDADDRCPTTGKRHKPDWSTVTEEIDGGTSYVDVLCANCGRSGCVGAIQLLEKEINW